MSVDQVEAPAAESQSPVQIPEKVSLEQAPEEASEETPEEEQQQIGSQTAHLKSNLEQKSWKSRSFCPTNHTKSKFP